MNQLIAFWNILKKDMKNYYLKPPNISWGIIFPISWTLMFSIRTGDINYREILPGVMALSILFGTTSMLAVSITFERKSRSFERLLLSPIRLTILMLAKTTGAILFGFVNAFVPVIFACFLIDLSGIQWSLLILGIFLISLTSTFLGLFIAVSVSEVFEAQTFSNFFRFPMMFLCGLFFPISQLPLFLQPLSYILPLTYGVDLLQFSVNKTGIIWWGFDIGLLFCFGLILFLFSCRNIQKKWIL